MNLCLRMMAPILLAAFLSPLTAYAQAYPSKLIRVVIPWPGGSNDAAGRIVFQKVAESIGQPVVIENRSGASGSIGAAFVAKSAPDGYTVMVTSATLISNAHLYKNLPFDTLNDFIGITPLTVQTGILIVHPSLPVKSVKELIALAKARPNQILYGSSGSGSFLHLTMAHFNVMTGTKMTHVPYKGGAAAGIGVAAGELQAMVASMPIVRPHLGTNRIRLLGVTSATRMKALPDVPTIAEAGVPGYEFTAWVAAFVPAGTPRAIVDKLSAEIKKALDNPDVAGKFDNLAFETLFMTPEKFAVRLKSDSDKYAKLIALTGAKVD
ncbi:MAG: tripartite tricarboxylate transporter substrate binding protein [Betaproteobacteria bacterium]